MNGAPEPGLADRLSHDVSSLIATVRSPWTWLLAAALVVLMVGAWRLRQLLAQDRRLTPRVRALASASINALTAAVVVVVAAWFLWRQAPLLLGISLAVLAATVGLGLGIRGRGWVWGLATIWRGRVRIGDRLRLGAIDGRVADVGLFGITVIADDGARVFVPNTKLAGDTFSVASPEEVHPAEITVRADDRELTDADVETLRRIGAPCASTAISRWRSPHWPANSCEFPLLAALRNAPSRPAPITRNGSEGPHLNLPRIVEEYALDAINELGADETVFTRADRDWVIAHSASTLPEIEKGTHRLVALRQEGSIYRAAIRLGISHVALSQWLRRRRYGRRRHGGGES